MHYHREKKNLGNQPLRIHRTCQFLKITINEENRFFDVIENYLLLISFLPVCSQRSDQSSYSGTHSSDLSLLVKCKVNKYAVSSWGLYKDYISNTRNKTTKNDVHRTLGHFAPIDNLMFSQLGNRIHPANGNNYSETWLTPMRRINRISTQQSIQKSLMVTNIIVILTLTWNLEFKTSFP